MAFFKTESINDIVKSRTIDYRDWLDKNYDQHNGYNSESFRIWWSTIMQPEYTKVYWEWLKEIGCEEYHKKLFTYTDFFSKIQKYMEDTNWTWSDSSTPPSLNDMYYTILDLSHMSACSDGDIGGNCSTGGFAVEFYPKKYLNITFSHYSTDEILFEKKIDVEDLRINKLRKICDE